MAYEKQNFEDGTVLKASHLNHIEDGIANLDEQIYYLGGSWIDITNYMQPTSASFTGSASFGVIDNGWSVTRSATGIAAFGVGIELGYWKNIKNRTYYFMATNASEDTEDVIYMPYFYITRIKGFNFSNEKVDLKFGNVVNQKTLKFIQDFSTLETGYDDDDLVYLVSGFRDENAYPTMNVQCWYITQEFVEGATGNGEYKDVKYNYYEQPATSNGCSVSLQSDDSYILTPSSDNSRSYQGCVIPLEKWSALKNKKIGFTLEDVNETDETNGLIIQLTAQSNFNVNYGIYNFISGSEQSFPYSSLVNIPESTNISLEDDDMVYLLIYANFSSSGNPLTMRVSIYYYLTEWVESPIDLSGYYTKEETDEKISELAGSTYSKYTLYSIGDSLCAGGQWQAQCATKLGCNFSQDLNADPSHPTSIGGTASAMSRRDSTFFRAMNLINYGEIKKKGENAIICIQNVNDGTFTFDSTARSYTLVNEVDIDEITSEALAAIDDTYKTWGTVLRQLQKIAGKVLTINTLPTIEGDITLKIGWAGPGVSNYNVHVVPQATDEETLQYVYDRIIEYDFKGIHDAAYDNGTISGVSFSSGSASYMPTVEFTDTDSTGMTVTITEVDDTVWGTCYWFDSDDLSNWTDTSYWVTPKASSGWKSAVEALIAAFPKAKIAIVHLPRIAETQANYLKSNGLYDEVAFYNSVNDTNVKEIERCKAIADLYRLKFIDVYSYCGICATNLTNFYPANANVHPSANGYIRWGDIIAGEIQSWIKS